MLPVSILALAAQYSLSVLGALVEGVAHGALAAVTLGTHVHADLPVVHLAPEVRLRQDVYLTRGAVRALLTRGVLQNHVVLSFKGLFTPSVSVNAAITRR